MELSRSDATRINGDSRREILHKFSLTERHLMTTGTEAEVYEVDDNRLLKLYHNPGQLDRITTLKGFYDSIDESASGVRIPRILDIVTHQNTIGVIETRIPGVSLESLMAANTASASRWEDLYLDALRAMSQIRLLEAPSTYLLFDPSGRNRVEHQGWNTFYQTLLKEKLNKISWVLETTVTDFPSKSERLLGCFEGDVQVPLAVVHGDFFPGNVLIHKDATHVTGVIDFGSFTMFGDRISDVAGAVGFYRMYDPDRESIRRIMISKVLPSLSSEEHPRLFRYLLSHATLTCDLYVTEQDLRQDGHFCWAMEILNTDDYWHRLG